MRNLDVLLRPLPLGGVLWWAPTRLQSDDYELFQVVLVVDCDTGLWVGIPSHLGILTLPTSHKSRL